MYLRKSADKNLRISAGNLSCALKLLKVPKCFPQIFADLRRRFAQKINKSTNQQINKSFLILFFFLASLPAAAQNDASVAGQDSNQVQAAPVLLPIDTIIPTERSLRPEPRVTRGELDMRLPLMPQIWQSHPYYDFNATADARRSPLKPFFGKETFFYVIIALLLLFATLRNAFAKYFNDLFRVFFRTTLKQRQIREQLMQTPLPSLAFNVFFVASASLYIGFLLYDYFAFRPVDSFWLFCLYAGMGLVAIYFVKFVALKLMGWMFSVQQAAESYIFIVFIINKVLGIFLLPFLVLLAFATGPLYSVALMVSWVGIVILFLYRFVLGLAAARKEVRFNLFHFVIYVAAFEVAPIFLLYRLLIFRF